MSEEVACGSGHHRQDHIIHRAIEPLFEVLDRHHVELMPIDASLTSDGSIQGCVGKGSESGRQCAESRLSESRDITCHVQGAQQRRSDVARGFGREGGGLKGPIDHEIDCCGWLSSFPRWRWFRGSFGQVCIGTQERLEDAHARDSIHQAVMDLRDQCVAPILQPFYEPQLP